MNATGVSTASVRCREIPRHDHVIDELTIQQKLAVEDAFNVKAASFVKTSRDEVRAEHVQFQEPRLASRRIIDGLIDQGRAEPLALHTWINRQTSDYRDVGIRCESAAATYFHVANDCVIDDSDSDIARRIGREEVCVFAPQRYRRVRGRPGHAIELCERPFVFRLGEAKYRRHCGVTGALEITPVVRPRRAPTAVRECVRPRPRDLHPSC
jgi:hypothetical protein